jgi:Core-2/I-Branching enzyme
MSPTIGFILLTHNKPHQIVRLVQTLNRMFDRPPIVSHHDFSKCDLPLATFPENFAVVRPHEITGWGIFSVVEGTFRAIELMYKAPNPPDWFVLLSAADYPIKSANQILDDLSSGGFDVYNENVEITYKQYLDSVRLGGTEGSVDNWFKECYERYRVAKFEVQYPNRRLGITKRVITLRHPLLTKFLTPFSSGFRCFAGGQWFSANRKAAEYLINFHRSQPKLANHYRRLERLGDAKTYSQMVIPDESYYQTVLCNAADLQVKNDNRRYVNWFPIEGDRPPKTLLMEDLPILLKSPAHFARKFDIDRDSQVLDELDKVIGL